MAGTANQQDRIVKYTYEDAAELAPWKHAKALYIEYLKIFTEWHSYSVSKSFSVADMAMYACKNIGCALKYLPGI